MKTSKHYLIIVLQLVFALLPFLVRAQDQSGFISLDCGSPKNTSYSEPTTAINYISDAAFIDTGTSRSILPEYKPNLQRQVEYVRSFPQGIRNCYRINITSGNKYLIRAIFLYGNYDGQNKIPKFDLHFGASFWDAVSFSTVISSTVKEIVHIPFRDYVQICLINTGSGTPFVSALELRLLKNTTYVTPSGSLALFLRSDIGSTTNQTYRYPNDVFDRIWFPYTDEKWKKINTSLTVDPQDHIDFQPPSDIMNTAGTPINSSDPLELYWEFPDVRTQFVYMHFAELQQLKPNQSRVFDIVYNGKRLFDAMSPRYLESVTIFTPTALTGSNASFSLVRLENSTMPPILNAIEVYTLIDFSQPGTEQVDVDAITNIKSSYGVSRNWQGDPCAPVAYSWAGLNCSYEGFDSPRIISLNMSSSGLTGQITPFISSLTMLQSLDLSNNSLTGSVPDFLSALPNLRVLNLQGNKLAGSVPAELIRKSNSGLLSLSVGENQNLCASLSCKKKNNILIPIASSVGALVVLLTAAAILVGLIRKKKQVVRLNGKSNMQNEPFESKKRQFTYSEVVHITNNFERILGKGGFGTVFHGLIDGAEVAVKMLSASSSQGYQQFKAEVNLLTRVYHRNLTSLVGYCNEDTNMALIYEYMANGNLESHLSGDDNENVLSWEGRLQIATDAAQGLEYLHNGCKPPIIHRDVKASNILLNDNFQAKVADFGLSRNFPTDGGTHISTNVVGTPGYLDPEYYITNRLNEKSDVYSFGVVLLEIITGQPAISRTQERTHISQSVSFMLSNGDIGSVVDEKLQGDFEINSVWKAVEIAMACISPTPTRRPNMNLVVTELKDCLASELARKNTKIVTDSTDSNEMFSINATTELSPLAR